MVDISIGAESVTFRVLGLHKLWALRSTIRVPLSAIESVAPGEAEAREGGPGLRLPGTHLPDVITAGSYRKAGQWTFWDVVRPTRTIAVRLQNQRYARLIIDVADPGQEIQRLREAVAATA